MSAINASAAFARKREIFLEALELPNEGERSAFLARATEGDGRLRAVIESLLAQHQSDDFLEIPATNLAADAPSPGFVEEAGEKPGEMIGRYKLLEVIGEGGYGTVFLAEQREPVRRQVALKLIKLGMDTKSVVARFEAERQALALMDHPGIARVLDGGTTARGRPYFVMELVRGVRITEYSTVNELSISERVKLFIQLCHAVQHAHHKGVIHRDLKPSNVLVTLQDGKPLPKVIDFGIAKAMEEPLTEKTLFTNFHVFIGTPAYTSPEQARMAAGDVDTRSDIYSLGILLYELLTGATPFDPRELTQSGLDEMRRMINEVDPPRPSTRLLDRNNPGKGHSGKNGRRWRSNSSEAEIDADLDWIVLKSLEKDRGRRYSTVQELAADLQRYLDDEPVLARPPSARYRLKKAFYRRRGLFTAAAAIVISLLVGAGLSLRQAFRATRAEHAAELGRLREVSLRQKAETQRERALENQRRSELNEYIADINLAHQSIVAGNLTRAIDLLGKHEPSAGRNDVRGFEWRYLWRLAQGDERLTLAHEPSSIVALASSPEFVAVGLRDSVKIYDLKTGKALKTIEKSGTSLALAQSGLLATASRGTTRLWRTGDWTELLSLSNHPAPVAFSIDGGLIAANSRSGIHILNSADGQLISQLAEGSPPFAFAPGGHLIASDARSGIAVWDARSGTPLRTLEKSAGLFNRGWIQDKPALQFSPDGRLIAAARNVFRSERAFAIEVWDSATGNHLATIPGEREKSEHTGLISAIAFSPDGKLLASASWDHSVRVWDLAERRALQTLQGHLAEVWALSFAADGEHIISGGKDGTVVIWPLKKPKDANVLPGNWTALGFSEDGRSLAAVKDDTTLVRLNVETRDPEHQLDLGDAPFPFRGPFLQREISRDLQVMAELVSPDTIRLWDVHTKANRELKTPNAKVETFALSPDGTRLITGHREGGLLWWNLRNLSEPYHRSKGQRALFSANGRVLVTIAQNAFAIWDWPAGVLRTNHLADDALNWATALSSEGDVLATGSDPQDVENAIRLWDTRSGKLIGICAGHTQGVARFAFSTDGRTLASTSTDNSLRLWNVATQQQLIALEKPGIFFADLLFSPGGKYLVAKTLGGETGGLRFFPGTLKD